MGIKKFPDFKKPLKFLEISGSMVNDSRVARIIFDNLLGLTTHNLCDWQNPPLSVKGMLRWFAEC